uniref:Uncharacterized protein n=1 Tax=Arion vulgaris TaxID=1028688 RepID=A0A0B7BCR0_9EUPU
MHAVLDFLLTLKNVIVAFVVSWVRFFIPPDRKCVKGEIVLITGAGRGIGQSLALEFAKLKAVTVLWDISEKGLKETAKMITDAAGECHTYICDISDRQQIKVMGDRVKTEVGDVTILINNAGIVIGKTLLELRDEQIERTFGVNLLGQIWTTKHFCRQC